MTGNATEPILGYAITTSTCEDCAAQIVTWIDDTSYGRYVACANPHSLEIARVDAVFQEALRTADLLVPDGIGIVIASMINGGTIRQRVTGSDIFQKVNTTLNGRGKGSVFFLGSTPEVLERIRERMAMDCPAVRIAGTYSPPFREVFNETEMHEMIEAVNAARPDVLWVGLTAPKQEKWIFQNRSRLQVKAIGAVGAVFDFYSGRRARSHPFFQNVGLEWLPRLLREPRRLWKRTIVSSPSFLLRVLRERFHARGNR